MDNSEQKNIDQQREKLKSGLPEIQLIKPCILNNGIIPLPEIKTREVVNESISLFIPASGAGSRMFQSLFDYLNDFDLTKKEIKQFSESVANFAFYKNIDSQLRIAFEGNQLSLEDLIKFIFSERGLNYARLPKGLIPFHLGVDGTSNPFQDSIIQGLKLGIQKIDFHFTIQREFENEIMQSISKVLVDDLSKVQFSEQYKETDSIIFDSYFNPIKISENQFLTRPSGHGALLTNLNRVDADYILIRNIDNVQHSSKSQNSIDVWNRLLNLTLQINKEFKKIWKNPTKEALLRLNEMYHFYDSDHIDSIKTSEQILALINRPLRICGMVTNSGQQGGGPYWVKNKSGFLTKQIVEETQILSNKNQQDLLEKSTHFNPVMIVASVKDFTDKKYDLTQFADHETYFIVSKTYQGKMIQYIERPGLWNGSMAQWTSVFVEIPSEVFSPVKTIMDLLDDKHKL
ncbi:MAG: DUF4301 family protein [Bacteroidetes bacterium]|nr:DUF4301 family protein [Bacteroidota bacterium]